MAVYDLQEWKSVEIEEVSAGVYQLKAVHSSGASFEARGVDPDKLMSELREYAAQMQQGQ